MGRNRVRIAPSLLSADFSNLREDIAVVEGGGADMLHLDVMDGHFVPNLTFGPFIVKAIHRVATTPLDVHLMIEEPLRYAPEFAEAGATFICYHVECGDGSPETAKKLREMRVLPAVAIKPDTPIEAIREHLPHVDMVMVMSVEPGFGGQAFREYTVEKVRALRAMGYEGSIEMDGGIDKDTIGTCVEAGADTFVAGSAIFKADDPAAMVGTLRRRGEAALPIHR